MRRTASEILQDLEIRVASLEKQAIAISFNKDIINQINIQLKKNGYPQVNSNRDLTYEQGIYDERRGVFGRIYSILPMRSPYVLVEGRFVPGSKKKLIGFYEDYDEAMGDLMSQYNVKKRKRKNPFKNENW